MVREIRKRKQILIIHLEIDQGLRKREIIKRETDNKHKEIAVQMMMEEKEKVTREMVQKDKET
jgi:hypothetical protein